MTVTPFYFRFYICVEIFITIERILKIFLFWAYDPLNDLLVFQIKPLYMYSIIKLQLLHKAGSKFVSEYFDK